VDTADEEMDTISCRFFRHETAEANDFATRVAAWRCCNTKRHMSLPNICRVCRFYVPSAWLLCLTPGCWDAAIWGIGGGSFHFSDSCNHPALFETYLQCLRMPRICPWSAHCRSTETVVRRSNLASGPVMCSTSTILRDEVHASVWITCHVESVSVKDMS